MAPSSHPPNPYSQMKPLMYEEKDHYLYFVAYGTWMYKYMYIHVTSYFLVHICVYSTCTVYVINVMASTGSGCMHNKFYLVTVYGANFFYTCTNGVINFSHVYAFILFVFPVDPGNPTLAVSIVHLFA